VKTSRTPPRATINNRSPATPGIERITANRVKGRIKKKLVLISGLAMLGLSGCFVVPHRSQDDGYHNDRDHRDERKDSPDHGGHDDRRDGSNDRHDQYH